MKKMALCKLFPPGEKLRRLMRVMKITWLIILLASLQISASVYSQQTTFNVEFRNASLYDLMKEIKSNSEFDFIYSDDEIESVRINDANFYGSHVEQILDECLNGTEITYSVEDKVIILMPAPPKPIVKTPAQKYEVQGTVTDKDGIALPGVSVVIKGTSIGTATDIDGKYTLRLESQNATLVFSFVGMLSQEVAYTGQKAINVTLTADSEQMAEVVVTGYSSISKERATGSFVKIGNEELERVHHVTVEDKLKGTAPGVLLSTQPGDGGEEVVIEMRGKATLKGQANPLLVVDGFPVEMTLAQLNPSDIESINILQDAAASSIWGARAANGVIVVTTKKGTKSGRPEIEFSYNLRLSEKPRLSDMQMASSSQIVDAHLEALDMGLDYDVQYSQWGYDYFLNPVQQIYLDHLNDPAYTLEMRDADLDKLRNTNGVKQYEDILLRTGVTHDGNFNVRGGNENVNYYFSYSYRSNESIYLGDDSKRNNITLNNDFKLSDRIKLTTGVNLLFENQNYNGVGLDGILGNTNISGATMPVYQKLVDEKGNPIQYYSGSKSIATLQDLESRGFLSFTTNPYQSVLESDNVRKKRNTRLNANLNYEILDGLSLDLGGMYEYAKNEHRNYQAAGTFGQRSLYNQFSYFENKGTNNEKVLSFMPKGGILDLYQYNSSSYTLRAQLNYNKQVGNHQINGLVGTEFRDLTSDSRQREEVGYDDELGTWGLIDYKALAAGVTTEIGGFYKSDWNPNNFVTQAQTRYASYFMNLAYTYNNKYTFTVSGRIDDGSMFGVDASKRKTPLWAIGGSWNISQEDFFDVKNVDFLKLRLTYGKNGSVNNAFSSLTTLAFHRYLNWTTGEPFAIIKNYANPDLKWETTATTNVAVDFGLFNHRLNGTLEVYNRKSTDVLATFNINPMQGIGDRTFNNGVITNKGFTFQLSGDIGKQFVWTPGLNISYNKNKVEKAEAVSTDPITFLDEYYYDGKVKEGYSVDEVFGFNYAGLDENGDPRIYDGNGDILTINDPQVSDINAVKSLGTMRPKYWGAFTNSFRYKNFALHTIISYKFGHVFEKPAIYWNQAQNGVAHKSIADRWQKPGDEVYTDIPGLKSGYNYLRSDYFGYVDARYLKADHIRFQDISLTYDLPKGLFKNVSNIQLRAQVSNLGLIWKANDEGFDPEYVPFGSNNFVTQMTGEPSLASRPGAKPRPIYNFGVKVNF